MQKKSEVPAAERIRDNQRRSRMRQKEHIEELKQRIAEFERRGIEATIEVQRAARRVANENQLLRDLLTMHGVSQEQVESFVVNSVSSSLDNQGQRSSSISIAVHPPTSTNTTSPYSPSTCPPSVCSPSNQSSQSISTCTPSTHSPAKCCTILTNPSTPLREYSTQPSEIVGSPNSFDTACEEAAKLLASVRGLELEDAMQALGCDGQETCNIKNTDLLEIMDS
jgi:hypothetical protein